MNYFYLVRHGQKKNIKGNPSLSDLGKKQAEYTAKYLKRFPISKIYGSPFRRTQETANFIACVFNLSVVIEKNLRERINWGDDLGLSFNDFIKLWEKTSQDRNYKPKVGDSSRKAGQRLEQVIKEISGSKEKSHIVLITHGGIIADFLRNVFSEDYLRKFKFDFPEEQEKYVKECSITIIKESNNNFELLELASDKHLPFPVE